MPHAARTYRPKGLPRGIDRNRPNSYRRGYWTKDDKQIREAVFFRDRWICQNPSCGITCIENAKNPKIRPHCDHIIPKARGGSDLPFNRQTLCGSCHSKKTIGEGV